MAAAIPRIATATLVLAATLSAAEPATGSDALLVRAVTSKSFADVVEELEFAITEHNFRITGRNTLGAAIRERGHDGFPEAEVIHFCNLEYARVFMELDVDFIAQMPCRMTVHEAGGQTVIHAVLLPEDHVDPRLNAEARRLNGILREIVDFVLEDNH